MRAVRHRRAGHALAASAGWSLVEMLVGLALGLFVIANGIALLGGQLHEGRALIAEARLTQDLREAMTAIARDLRRAGQWNDAAAGLWQPGREARPNPYQAIGPAADALLLRYSRDPVENHRVDANEEFGFRLRNQAIDLLLGGSWQTLTDSGTVRITALRLTPRHFELAQPALCERPCPPPGPDEIDCPPRVQVRQFDIEIAGESAIDPQLRRSLRGSVRLRNDALAGTCPA